ncbi:DUF4181 domain-containing protein [Allobacillus sp. GCM10007490]|uniref:DUF4181 domain-containing protein n=1 Tax=Allobacillus salarius TaxID=1955272 RepID=A0A556P8V3_9BACI|nr:DUF4181 domain-containing protein [Allobacillus salarius]
MLRRVFLRSVKGNLVEKKEFRVEITLKIVILIIALISAIFIIVNGYEDYFKWLWIALIGCGLGIQALFEWLYVKNSKEYVITIITMVVGILLITFFY